MVRAQTVWVPFSVLNDSAQSAGNRLVWVLLNCCDSDSLLGKRLSELSGLSPKTIASSRAKLSKAPLAPCFTKPHPVCGALPLPLLTNTNLSPVARLLYGQLQGVPGFANQQGSFTYKGLSDLTGSSDDTMRRVVLELVHTGWLTVSRANRKSPIEFTLRNPSTTQAQARLSAMRRKIKKAPHRGEALLREYLNLLVALDKFEENAAPDFLLNPYTGELMEFDRYYPAARVAFEFQGAQHYEITDLATLEATVKQVGRDAMKAFICKLKGIELVAIHPEDLSRRTLERKIPDWLPRRDLKGQELRAALLDGLAAEYRERTARERQSKGPA